MTYFVQGLWYGLLAFGWLISFTGCLVVLISICTFLAWIGERINPDADVLCDEEDDDDV